ncbi:hypothetical protein CCUS01_05365 [Colletotrichum cuscutae]|uniref:Uncharacterized protein n=1 Tax=Colletotrichum cuscutae TaxID=1209917 RepID=A0AAI9V9F3_9PEZI|nr:hypothetical protein CCUS01_05365 [Colletotrichum cuscutae]
MKLLRSKSRREICKYVTTGGSQNFYLIDISAGRMKSTPSTLRERSSAGINGNQRIVQRRSCLSPNLLSPQLRIAGRSKPTLRRCFCMSYSPLPYSTSISLFPAEVLLVLQVIARTLPESTVDVTSPPAMFTIVTHGSKSLTYRI